MDKIAEAQKRNMIILYGRPGCPMLAPVRGMLNRAKVDYLYMDISQDMPSRLKVREINNGNESVPTLHFPDDTTLTEPAMSQLRAKLEEMGYDVPTAKPWDVLKENLYLSLIGLGLILFGVYDGNPVFIGGGVLLTAIILLLAYMR
ncbi:MAG TPA: hypothetical protein ENJ93_02985 [Chloroflexi bacterium]|nr:hypothetical protein [Chloroflexota bacterium]